MNFIAYKTDGAIIGTGSCPVSMLEAQKGLYPPGTLFIEGEADSELHYVDGSGVIQDRIDIVGTPTITGLEVDLSFLPPGCEVFSEGYNVVSDPNGAVVEYETPGEYIIRVRAPVPYAHMRLEVTVG